MRKISSHAGFIKCVFSHGENGLLPEGILFNTNIFCNVFLVWDLYFTPYHTTQWCCQKYIDHLEITLVHLLFPSIFNHKLYHYLRISFPPSCSIFIVILFVLFSSVVQFIAILHKSRKDCVCSGFTALRVNPAGNHFYEWRLVANDGNGVM